MEANLRKHWPRRLLTMGLLIVLLVQSACTMTLPSGDVVTVPDDFIAETDAAEPQATPADEGFSAVAQSEPIPFTLLEPAEGETLSAAEVYSQISPSVAYVCTPYFAGSGYLTEYGYLATAAHVVWLQDTARVVFPNGKEYADLPVAARDLLNGVALLGPIDLEETELEPLVLTDSSDASVGDEVYLIGYPAEAEEFPQPTLDTGFITHIRNLDATGITMSQIDGDIRDGQSGGVMVNRSGDVIGMIPYGFGESQDPIVTVSDNFVSSFEAILRNNEQAMAGRWPYIGECSRSHTGILEDNSDKDYYFGYASDGDDLIISVDGYGDPQLVIVSPDEHFLENTSVNPDYTGNVEVQISSNGTFVVGVHQLSNNRNEYVLYSNRELYLIPDLEDGRQVEFGETVFGKIDHPDDVDSFNIDLKLGDKLAVSAQSMMFDPMVGIHFQSKSRFNQVYDYANGQSETVDKNAMAVMIAEEDGQYQIEILSTDIHGSGAYSLTVQRGTSEHTTNEYAWSYEFYQTSVGDAILYEDSQYPVTMLVPFEFNVDPICRSTICFHGPVSDFTIYTRTMEELPLSQRNSSYLIDEIVESLVYYSTDMNTIYQSEWRTAQGSEVSVTSVELSDRNLLSTIFAATHEAKMALMGISMRALNDDEDAEIAIDKTKRFLSTVRFIEPNEAGKDATFYLQNAMRDAAKEHDELAIEAIEIALSMDPDIEEAYNLRYMLHLRNNELLEALMDAERVYQLRPNDPIVKDQLAQAHWFVGDTEHALVISDEIAEQYPESKTNFRHRALYKASIADYEGALHDLEDIAIISENGLSDIALESRAYINLKSDELDYALEDYRELLSRDVQDPYTLLGIGVTLARLGKSDEAMPYLEYGLEKLEASDPLMYDPVIRDLLDWASEYIEIPE